MSLQSYKDLTVWQKSIDLVKSVYALTGKLPKSEQFGLSSQMRRAAISIPSNIAEGYSRKGRGEYVQFLHIAAGSAAELETQLIICSDLYPNTKQYIPATLVVEIQKMLYVLISKLNPKP